MVGHHFSEPPDSQVAIQKDRSNVRSRQQVLKVVGGFFQLLQFSLKLRIHRMKFLVDAVQLFIRALQFFVGSDHLFVGRLQLFITCFQFFDRGVEAFAGKSQLRLQQGEVIPLLGDHHLLSTARRPPVNDL